MSTTARITVAYIDPPGEGKKQATIKDSNGTRYGIFPEKMGDYRKGGTYDVEFKSREWQGKNYHTITSAKPVNGESNGSNGNESNGHAPVAGSNGNGKPDEAYWAKRNARIERQHAQKVAVEFLKLEVDKAGATKGKPTLERLFQLADQIAADIENAGTIEVAKLNAEVAPDEQEPEI
jgi:hypothetical protein